MLLQVNCGIVHCGVSWIKQLLHPQVMKFSKLCSWIYPSRPKERYSRDSCKEMGMFPTLITWVFSYCYSLCIYTMGSHLLPFSFYILCLLLSKLCMWHIYTNIFANVFNVFLCMSDVVLFCLWFMSDVVLFWLSCMSDVVLFWFVVLCCSLLY